MIKNTDDSDDDVEGTRSVIQEHDYNDMKKASKSIKNQNLK